MLCRGVGTHGAEHMREISRLFTAFFLLCLFVAPSAGGYSLLTHEQLIDLTWEASIVPLLRSRYPTLTAAELERARAYAYGGCMIQDIGYYPYGDSLFSSLTHYVRSGDFVINLVSQRGERQRTGVCDWRAVTLYRRQRWSPRFD